MESWPSLFIYREKVGDLIWLSSAALSRKLEISEKPNPSSPLI
jgi:hypothetical protein